MGRHEKRTRERETEHREKDNKMSGIMKKAKEFYHNHKSWIVPAGSALIGAAVLGFVAYKFVPDHKVPFVGKHQKNVDILGKKWSNKNTKLETCKAGKLSGILGCDKQQTAVDNALAKYNKANDPLNTKKNLIKGGLGAVVGGVAAGGVGYKIQADAAAKKAKAALRAREERQKQQAKAQRARAAAQAQQAKTKAATVKKSSGFPWMWFFIGLALLLVVAGVVVYFVYFANSG